MFDYCIIDAATIAELTDLMNTAFASGYIALGGVVKDSDTGFYIQAVARSKTHNMLTTALLAAAQTIEE